MNLTKLTKISLYFRFVIAIVLMGSMIPAASPAQAGSAIVDGSVDDAYGAPIAVDKPGDGNGNANMDLLELYVTEDTDHFYFAFTANADLGAANWGKYVIYIDTDGVAGSGATSDAWGRAVTAADPHKPEYALYTWLDAAPYDPGDTQVVPWNGASWDWGAVSSVDEVALGANAVSVIEWKVAKAKLGNPSSLWLEVWNTGGDGGDNAQDTINFPAEDWNATDWSTPAMLAVSTPYFVMDGAREATWGEAASTDPLEDMSEPNLNLHGLYLAEDASSYYIGLDAYASTWSMTYGIYLDTDQVDGSGATSDPWGRAVNAVSAHLPEYALYIYHNDNDTMGDPQLTHWFRAGWEYPTLVSVGGVYGYNGANDWLEYRIPKEALGHPDHLALEAFTTGGSGHAQDTVPSDPNVAYTTPDWGAATTTLSSFYIYPPVVEPPHASHDNTVWWNELGHDSRSTTYRTPGGAVPTGTPVILRLRAASGDLTAAQVRLYNDRTNAQSFLDMELVADDGTYEWWQAEVPASADPTVYWYRFLAIDGTDTDFYEDDGLRTGGWGMVYDESEDVSYQLTVYDPEFQTPDWIKDAIVYQVFPDRFRDGDSTNNTPAGTFFYNEAGGTVYRSLDPEGDWNTVICDPRDATPCAGTYSKNFYGGDLQGLTEKLDYLQKLGVNTIYLNPIFESPSNHKYDTTDYMQVDDAFGGNAAFAALVTALEGRGMHLILDGVFNHTSSDSIFFDRYGRYSSLGACESPTSPYRDWYYFYAPPSGTPGVCTGDDGTPNALLYESWFGYDSLPKLRANSQEVRDYIWALDDKSVAPYWIYQGAGGWRLDVGGDVDPGTLNDPANDYWEGFRDALLTASPDPQPYIVGEEWGNATSWTIGGEWDATMNYQYSSAMLGLWVDRAFFDNDHNYGSSAGVIEPLMPSQLDERLHNWQERYAPEAFYAMMNLLGSHDTSRALFMLDTNTYLNDESLYLNPDYDWSDAITRLKGVVILQMTLPGAPTIYYGDEIGLVGPPAYAGDKWEDDPYNRQPYPWLDEGGTPFYTHLQSATTTQALYDYYATLTAARNAHPALRTGSFDTLLVDDPKLVYAYGRKLADGSDAAVVIVNRHDTTYNAVIDLEGYLPYGTGLVNVLDDTNYTVGIDGTLSISIPPMTGAVLVTTAAFAPAPAPVTDLAVVTEGDATLTLDWTPITGATHYDVYRSLLDGGGYSLVGATTESTYADTGLTNGLTYYYVVISRDSTTGLVSGYSNQAQGIPHPAIGWANLQHPPAINHTIGINPTENIYGQVWIDGYTALPGATPGLLAQVGFGAADSAPATWVTWVSAVFNTQAGNNDEFKAQLLPETLGVFDYVYRYSTSSGRDWVYADLSGPINGNAAAPSPGVLTVLSSGDTTAPAVPVNLRVTSQSATEVALAWDASPDSDIYAYDLYRSEDSASLGVKIARLLSPTITYVDSDVVSGITYYYVVRALDTSFNVSANSNQVAATPAPRLVNVTLSVTVPTYTPSEADVYFSRYVNPDGTLGGWDAAATRLSQIDATTYSGTLSILEGTLVEFKFTRGSWDTVEKGSTFEEIANRSILVEYGATGNQPVSLTVENWRDPIVAMYSPADGSTGVPVGTTVTATWSRPMATTTIFEVKKGDQPVNGTFILNDAKTIVTFSPTEPLDYLA
ncbi:MAG: alpha-amylase family glycosyl hydrolase, partial [Anaerolineales bacterium]|nr:alpha-amylase family glycosyl hydrolase [Anaerolineales bacterium]